jgi:DNA polymerase I-like protein with 3'-5' exonuclease and polymerase domains
MYGNQKGYRLKLEIPRENQKYAEKSGTECRVFFLKKDIERLKNPLVPMIISEGEKAALSSSEHLPDYVSIAPTGCWNWVEKKDEALEGLREEDKHQLCQELGQIPWAKRTVFFCPDSDFFSNQNVHRAGAKLIQRLLREGAFVHLVKLSSQPKVALDDFIAQHGAEKLKKLLNSPTWKHLPIGQRLSNSDEIEGVILWDDDKKAEALQDLSKSSGQSIKSLRTKLGTIQTKWNRLQPREPKKQGPCEIIYAPDTEAPEVLFKRIGAAIASGNDSFYHGEEEALFIKEPEGFTRLYNGPLLSGFMNASRYPYVEGSYDKKGIFITSKYRRLDEKVAGDFFGNPLHFEKFRKINQIVTSPIVEEQNDGSFKLYTKPGYDEERQVYMDCEEIHPIHGTKHIDYGADYPFETPSDRANYLAFFLQTFFRGVFPGATPGFLIRANGQNCGKTRSARAISYVYSGQEEGSFSLPEGVKNIREIEMKFIAKLKKHDVLVYDNATVKLKNEFLDRIITAKSFSERETRETQDFYRKNDFLVGFTLNYETANEDLFTRCIVINLHTSKRKGRKEIDEWVLEHRKEILGELMYMIQNWIAAGCPRIQPESYKEKFTTWASVMNGILKTNGIHGFLENVENWAKVDETLSTCLEAMYLEAEKRPSKDTEYLPLSVWAQKIKMNSPHFFTPKTTDHQQTLSLKKPFLKMQGNEYPLETEAGMVRVAVSSKMDHHTKRNLYSAKITIKPDPGGPDGTEISGDSEFCGDTAGIEKSVSPQENAYNSSCLDSLAGIAGIYNDIDVYENTKKIKNKLLDSDNIKTPILSPQSGEGVITLAPDESWEDPHHNFEYVYSFKNKNINALLWNGECLGSSFSYDIETTVVPEGRPRCIVLAAACNGQSVFFIRPQDLQKFFEVNNKGKIIAHHGAFDLFHTSEHLKNPSWMFDAVERTRDTFVISRLYSLGAKGTSFAKDHGLAKCVKEHLDVVLPKEVTIKGKEVRTSYGDFGDSIDTMPAGYLHYLAYDVISTFELEGALKAQIATISPVKEKEQGYSLQIKESILAYILSQTGCTLNRELVAEYEAKWSELTHRYKTELAVHGFVPNEEGNQKELKRIFGQIEKDHGISLPKQLFKKGEDFSTKSDLLRDFTYIPFIDAYIRYKKANKISNDFLKRLSGKDKIHTNYMTIMHTGRWSSSPNLQNIPRPTEDIDLRKVFVARPGYKIIAADYVGAELTTLAVTLKTLFPYRKQYLCEAIQNRIDLHRTVASKFYGISPDQVTKDQRLLGKIANFGFAGGLTPKSMVANCKEKYGLVITLEESEKLKKAWMDSFPELYDFFALAEKKEAELVLESYPSASMPKGAAFQVMRSIVAGRTHTRSGREFSEAEKEWAWLNVLALMKKFPKLTAYQSNILGHVPDEDLSDALRSLLVNDLPLCHRRRAYCDKNSFLNTFFQGLAADIIYEAAYELSKSFITTGSKTRIVNAIHDELVFEVPEEDVEKEKQHITSMMTWSAQKYCGDVPMSVEFTTGDCWKK